MGEANRRGHKHSNAPAGALWLRQVMTDPEINHEGKVFAVALSILGPQFAESHGFGYIGKMVGIGDVNPACRALVARRHMKPMGGALVMQVWNQQGQPEHEPSIVLAS